MEELNKKQLEFIEKIKQAVIDSGIPLKYFEMEKDNDFKLPEMPFEDFKELYIGPPPMSDCLHVGCPECKGTGVKHNGDPCIHMISCPCNECSPH